MKQVNELKRAYEEQQRQALLIMDENNHLNLIIKQFHEEKEAAILKHIKELEEIEIYFQRQVFHNYSRVIELEQLLLANERKSRKKIDEFQTVLEANMAEIEKLYSQIVYINNSALADRRKNKMTEMNLKAEIRELLDYSEKLTEDFIGLAKEKDELLLHYNNTENSKLRKVMRKFLSFKNGK